MDHLQSLSIFVAVADEEGFAAAARALGTAASRAACAVAMAAAGFPSSEIGKALGRTRYSVAGMFSVMGIRPTKLRQAVIDQPQFPGPVSL